MDYRQRHYLATHFEDFAFEKTNHYIGSIYKTNQNNYKIYWANPGVYQKVYVFSHNDKILYEEGSADQNRLDTGLMEKFYNDLHKHCENLIKSKLIISELNRLQKYIDCKAKVQISNLFQNK